MNTKECICCHEHKKLYEFSIDRKRHDKLNTKCRDCVAKTRKETEIEMLRKKMPGHHRSFKNTWYI